LLENDNFVIGMEGHAFRNSGYIFITLFSTLFEFCRLSLCQHFFQFALARVDRQFIGSDMHAALLHDDMTAIGAGSGFLVNVCPVGFYIDGLLAVGL